LIIKTGGTYIYLQALKANMEHYFSFITYHNKVFDDEISRRPSVFKNWVLHPKVRLQTFSAKGRPYCGVNWAAAPSSTLQGTRSSTLLRMKYLVHSDTLGAQELKM
jgi:hypothetical protein